MSSAITVYAGSLSIVDDEGNVVFEQELTTDEIIERLLAAIPSDIEEENDVTPDDVEVEVEPEPAPARAILASQPVGVVGCEECGSRGRRHKNGCMRSGKAAVSEASQPSDVPSDATEAGDMLTEEQYDLVTDARENDFRFSPAQCAEELEIDEKEVNRAILMGSYEEYQDSFNRSL